MNAFVTGFRYTWKLGTITDQVDLNLERALKMFLPRYNLHWAEIRYVNLNGRKSYVYEDATPAQLRKIKRRFDDFGVKLSILDTAIYKITLPGTAPVGERPAYVSGAETAFARQLENLKRAADAGHALGTEASSRFYIQAGGAAGNCV